MKIHSIQTKIISLIAGSVFITAAILLITSLSQNNNIEIKIDKNLNLMLQNIAKTNAESIYLLCSSSHDRTIRRLDYNLKVAHDELLKAGAITFEDSVEWKAMNQFDKKVTEVKLPKILIGGKWLGQNYDPKVESIVVDRVKHYTRDATTIFQRMNNDGDMLRVCTSVISSDGKRAVGTYIPHKNPDGTPNPIITSILKGEIYHGRAFVVKEWCETAYEPIFDSVDKNKVIGMLYVGVGMDSVNKELRQAIIKANVGKTGYAYVLGGKGSQEGLYIISKNGERDGENIWEAKDSDGNYFIKSI
ncbi:MAG: Cache 3/Cache 2 fusion domain-containing protein, partial [Desulfobacterales bacterium]|nr:Cache 3/Cache 2 fusion domain-containing protein [Desulfobacterales bacterium]